MKIFIWLTYSVEDDLIFSPAGLEVVGISPLYHWIARGILKKIPGNTFFWKMENKKGNYLANIWSIHVQIYFS